MSAMKKIKDKIREHHAMHEEMRREREEWIRDYRTKWEANWRRGWDANCTVRPWGAPPVGNYQPRRHWFFMKVFMLLFWICAAFIVIQLFSNGSFSMGKVPHYLGWAFVVMLVAFFILRRMFGPLRMLMKGVNEISNGNLDFQFPVGRHHGEIYYLAESFNLMVRRVKEMVHSKDQLLLDVSHELRSPLTRLKLALEMSAESELKQSMLQDVAEMETMLTEILETERLRNGNGKLSLEAVNLTQLITETAAKYQSRKPGVKLMEPMGSVNVLVDSTRIKTVIQNLIENALKFSDKQKKPVEISLENLDGKIILKVHDFGVGIPTADQEKVFEPFYRVDKSRTKETGGYGLGLSLCREIMRVHGGDIRLESQVGQGTEVLAEFSTRVQTAIQS
jgi:signal transduction histidine kinase